MKEEKILLHGSKDIIEKPVFHGGEATNDYGYGFYCVPEKEIHLAREWACSPFNRSGKGYVNRYSIRMEGLKILELDKWDIIYWIAFTAKNRKLNQSNELIEKIAEKYPVPADQYDCIRGWRCDDTYSRIIVEFLDGSMSAEAVREATLLGHLHSQFVLVSEAAFRQLTFLGTEEVKEFERYRERFNRRKTEADSGIRECRRRFRNGRYIEDFL